MNSRSKQVAQRMFLITEDARTYIEAAVVHKGEVFTAEFDVATGSLADVMANAKKWQITRRRELESERKRMLNRRRWAARAEAEILADIVAIENDSFEKMVARLNHNQRVTIAAREDVRGVWARYGPPLVDHVIYVPSFQWI